MQYKVINHQTEELYGHIAKANHQELEKFLIEYHGAGRIIFADDDAELPGITYANVIMPHEDDMKFYERIRIEKRDLVTELKQAMLNGKQPFKLSELIDVNADKQSVTLSDGTTYFFTWYTDKTLKP